MTRGDARVIAAGLLADGMKPETLTPTGRQELRNAIDKLLELAGVGLTDMQRLAIVCGNADYADEMICPRCNGAGHVPEE